MAEETAIVQEPTQAAPPMESNPFGRNAWTESLPAAEPVTLAVTDTPPAEPAQPATTEPEPQPVVSNDWYKNYGWENEEAAKAEIEQLKTLKDKPQTEVEIKFENEQSKTLHELIRQGKTKEVKEFLELQDRLESYTTGDVSKENADEIIKMGMKLKYKDLSPEEINYKFNKEYAVPAEPVQTLDETEDEFAARKLEWQSKVNDVVMNKVIEAKLMRPELEQAKSKVVLPELEKPTAAANQPTPEQLEQIRQNFLSQLESNYTKAEGFTTKVKDESVEIPVSFKIPDEDKVAIRNKLQEGLDVNEYMDKRWFDDKGTPKVEQIITDLYQLENLDKILSGIANNSANKRLVEYRKSIGHIEVSTTPQQTYQPTAPQQNVNPFSKDAWSDRPPVLANN